jgi:hypothetical protein
MIHEKLTDWSLNKTISLKGMNVYEKLTLCMPWWSHPARETEASAYYCAHDS